MRQGILTQKNYLTFNYTLLATTQVLLGSIFLGLMSQISLPLPFTPVPVSLQTLAVFLLAITLGSRKAPLAVIAYLIQATIGLPVLAGGLSNPLWLLLPKAGYSLSFVLAVFLVARLFERQNSITFFKSWVNLLVGQIAIFTVGSLWLSCFFGLEKAFFMGVVPFISGAAMKITFTACLTKAFSRWKPTAEKNAL